MLDDILDKTPLLWLNPPISAINLWTPRHSGCVIRSRFLVLGYLLLGKTCSVKSWEFPNGPNLPTPVGPPFVRPLPWGVAWGSGTPLDSHDQRWRFSTFTGLILAAHWWSTERTYSFWLFFPQTGFGTMEKNQEGWNHGGQVGMLKYFVDLFLGAILLVECFKFLVNSGGQHPKKRLDIPVKGFKPMVGPGVCQRHSKKTSNLIYLYTFRNLYRWLGFGISGDVLRIVPWDSSPSFTRIWENIFETFPFSMRIQDGNSSI